MNQICTFADIKKINKYLNWSPKVDIEKGIKILKENINYWKDAPVWTKDKIDIATKEWFKYLRKIKIMKKKKIIDFSEVEKILKPIKRKGKKIVHCHGVFDFVAYRSFETF